MNTRLSTFLLVPLNRASYGVWTRGGGEVGRGRGRGGETQKGENDAGAAKLDTSPAVLSPSFILRTFYKLPR